MTKVGKVTLGILGAIGTFLGIRHLMKGAPPEYCCPYCGECFATLTELQEHVSTQHPGERIPVEIEWQ